MSLFLLGPALIGVLAASVGVAILAEGKSR